MKRLLAFAVAAAWVPSAAASTSPLTVSGVVNPPSIGVGDTFAYVVEVQVDAGKVDARRVKVVADTGPFATVGPSRIELSPSRIRLVQTLACLDSACAPLDGERRVELPAPRAGAAAGSATGGRAVIHVTPRISASVVDAPRAAYRRETALPATTSPVPAGWAATLTALFAALALGAAALILVEPRRGGTARATQGQLARALRLLRESVARSEPDRRRAADLLARALASRGAGPLADEATRLAWSAHRPAPPDADTLAADVERALRSQS